MNINDVVAGNRVTYTDQGVTLLADVIGINGRVAIVMFDRDRPIELNSEVDPAKLTLTQDGGYIGATLPGGGGGVSVISAVPS